MTTAQILDQLQAEIDGAKVENKQLRQQLAESNQEKEQAQMQLGQALEALKASGQELPKLREIVSELTATSTELRTSWLNSESARREAENSRAWWAAGGVVAGAALTLAIVALSK
jgi:cell division septum initiation protein DivIVA